MQPESVESITSANPGYGGGNSEPELFGSCSDSTGGGCGAQAQHVDTLDRQQRCALRHSVWGRPDRRAFILSRAPDCRLDDGPGQRKSRSGQHSRCDGGPVSDVHREAGRHPQSARAVG